MPTPQTPSFLGGGKSLSVALGSGSGDIVPDSEVFKSEDGNMYLTDHLNQKTFSNKATFANQYADQLINKGTVKRTALKARVFNLSKPEDLEEYNKILSSAVEDNPSVEITVRDKHFHKGIFYIYIEYNDVMYKMPEVK